MGDVTSIQLESLPLPHTGLLQVDIHLSAQIKATTTTTSLILLQPTNAR